MVFPLPVVSKMPRLSLLTAVFAAALACASATLAQQRTAISGTSVSLAPLPGFGPAAGFAGLMNPATQASVLVVEMPPEAHPQIARLFGDVETAKTNFARQNVTVSRIDQVDLAGGETAPVISGTQTAGSARLDKWIALFKGARTVMITVQSPEQAGLKPAEVMAMMASVSLGKEPSLEEKLGALPFRIEPAQPFRIIDTLGGSGVLMTVGERNTDPEGKQPLLIAVYQLSAPVPGGQLEKTAETLLRQTRDFQTATIEATGRTPFAGGEGVLLTGRFEHQNGTSKQFAQYLAVGPQNRFVRLIVMADEGEFAALRPAFEAVAASVAFRAGQ